MPTSLRVPLPAFLRKSACWPETSEVYGFSGMVCKCKEDRQVWRMFEARIQLLPSGLLERQCLENIHTREQATLERDASNNIQHQT